MIALSVCALLPAPASARSIYIDDLAGITKIHWYGFEDGPFRCDDCLEGIDALGSYLYQEEGHPFRVWGGFYSTSALPDDYSINFLETGSTGIGFISDVLSVHYVQSFPGRLIVFATFNSAEDLGMGLGLVETGAYQDVTALIGNPDGLQIFVRSDVEDTAPDVVPEPASLILLGTGLIGALRARWRSAR